MAVWSEVDLYDVAPASRFDSEYFDPYFLMIEEKLKKFDSKPLNKIADYINRGLQPQYDEEGTIKALRSVNIRNGMFSDTRQEFVTEDFYNKNPRGQVKTNDLLISSTGVGTLGRVLLNNQLEPLFADGHITIIRDIENRNLHFLSLFLQSKIGFALITRRQRGSSGQIEIYPDDIGSLPIPKFDDSIENEIGSNYVQALTKIKSSETLYQEAEALLLHELGLDALDLSDELTYERNFDEVAQSSRLDSDYYKPKYVRLLKYLKSIPHKNLGQLAELSGGATPLGANYLEEGIPFLRIQNIESNRLNLDDVVFIDEKVHSKVLLRSQLQSNDVLITITGRIGTTAVVPESLPIGNINQHIVRARLNENAYDPFYISVFMNSVGGRLQTEREAYGTTREALPYYCVRQIVIPEPTNNIEKKLRELIKNAEDTQQSAKQLLEDAKRRVEDMILGA